MAVEVVDEGVVGAQAGIPGELDRGDRYCGSLRLLRPTTGEVTDDATGQESFRRLARIHIRATRTNLSAIVESPRETAPVHPPRRRLAVLPRCSSVNAQLGQFHPAVDPVGADHHAGAECSTYSPAISRWTDVGPGRLVGQLIARHRYRRRQRCLG